MEKTPENKPYLLVVDYYPINQHFNQYGVSLQRDGGLNNHEREFSLVMNEGNRDYLYWCISQYCQLNNELITRFPSRFKLKFDEESLSRLGAERIETLEKIVRTRNQYFEANRFDNRPSY